MKQLLFILLVGLVMIGCDTSPNPINPQRYINTEQKDLVKLLDDGADTVAIAMAGHKFALKNDKGQIYTGEITSGVDTITLIRSEFAFLLFFIFAFGAFVGAMMSSI